MSGRLRRSSFHESVWSKAREALNLPNLPIHDLRRIGAALSAVTSATLKELMARLGQSSPGAASKYRRASRDRDWEVAKALGLFAQGARETTDKPRADADHKKSA